MKLSLRLFGHPQIHVDARRVDAPLCDQALLLLALLATHKGESLRREQVAFTLWPDLSESDARAALRRQLYTLQQVLPASGEPWISSTNKTIGWSRATDTWVDVVEFERLCESPETFAAAAELYTGEFAPYLDHEWAAGVRERLRYKLRRVRETLVRDYCAERDYLRALFQVEQLLQDDSWREDAVRQMMTIRFRLGDRAGALAYYRRFCDRLKKEFEVDPMPDTSRCYDTIARGQLESASLWDTFAIGSCA
jgi:DNA-binding SARP family transcriptional activator